MEQTNKKRSPLYSRIGFYILTLLAILSVACSTDSKNSSLKYKIEFRSYRDDSDMPGYKDRQDEATTLEYTVVFNQDFTKDEALAIADSLVKEHVEYNGKRVYMNSYMFLVDSSLDRNKGFKNEDKIRSATYKNGVFDYYFDMFGVPVE